MGGAVGVQQLRSEALSRFSSGVVDTERTTARSLQTCRENTLL